MGGEDQWDGSNRRVSDRWHVGKEIPIAVLLAVVAQTFGGIWWAASLSAKIDSAIAQIVEFKLERYTKEDARRDRELFLQLIEQQRQRDAEHERRIGDVESTIKARR